MRTGTRVTGLRLVLLAGCLSFATMWVVAQSPAPATATYVGSAACGRCHAPTFERWKRTRMANVVRDPREHPEAIVADFTTPNPLAHVHQGSDRVRLRQQVQAALLHAASATTTSAPAQWDVTHRVAPTVPPDRLVDGALSARQHEAARPAALRRLPLGQLRHRAQDGDGMERRLRAVPRTGQRSRRAARRATNIVNPARLRPWPRCDACIQCHSEGQPHDADRRPRFHWPVGSASGLRLADFWKLDEHTPGTQDTLAFPGRQRPREPDAGQRLRAEPDVHARGDLRELPRSARHAEQRRPDQAGADVVCLTCHGPKSPNGPHTATIEQHTHHRAGIGRQRVRQLPHAEDRA